MKFVEAKRKNLPNVAVWDSGTSFRELLDADDDAEDKSKPDGLCTKR